MKSVAIVFGRMNPPTNGHLELLRHLYSLNTDDKILFLSHSKDPAKNPLSFEQKLYFAKKLFLPVFPRLKISEENCRTLIEVLQALSGYDRVVAVVGEDRVTSFQQLLDKYNGIPDKSGNILYSFSSIEVVNSGDRVEGVSASDQRRHAAENDFEAFFEGTPTDDVDLARELFTAARRGMELIERRIRASIRKLLEADKLTPDQIAKLRKLQQQRATKQPTKPQASESISDKVKEKADEKKAEEAKKGEDSILNFRDAAKRLPADGGLSRDATDYSKARAQVLLVLAEPCTKYHAAAIEQFVRAPARISKGIPQGTPAYRFIAVISSKNDVVEDTGVKAVWIKDLVASSKSARIVYGKVEAIARLLAGRFGYLEFTGQGVVYNKTSALITAEWSRLKGDASTCIGRSNLNQLGITITTFDNPNSAQSALEAADKKFTADVSAFRNRLEKEDIIATELEKEIDAIADARKKAFIEELPKAQNLAYLEAIYYAFCTLYSKKYGKNQWDLFKTLFASEIQAAKDLGEEMGITQAGEAIGKLKNYLSGKTPEGEDSSPGNEPTNKTTY